MTNRRTCRERCFLVVTGLVLAAPCAAYGQFAVTHTEHDWRVTIGSHSYGLVQELVIPFDQRTTTIHIAGRTMKTRLRALTVLVIAAVPLGLASFCLLKLIAGRNRSEESGRQSLVDS